MWSGIDDVVCEMLRLLLLTVASHHIANMYLPVVFEIRNQPSVGYKTQNSVAKNLLLQRVFASKVY